MAGKGEGNKRKRRRQEAEKGEENVKERKEKENDEEESRILEGILFGKPGDVAVKEFGRETDEWGLLGVEDVASVKESGGDGINVGSEEGNVRGDVVEEKKKPVWVDEEEVQTSVRVSGVNRLRKLRKDEGEEIISGVDYVTKLRAQHAALNRGTSWAELPSSRVKRAGIGSDSEEDDDEIEVHQRYSVGQTVGSLDSLLENKDLVVRSSSRLPQGLIEVTAMTDGNSEDPSNAVVQSVEFHKNAQILMTAGFDKKLRFFQIDGKKNPKVQSIFLEDFPIHKASFVPNGSKVLAAGRRNFYFMYDLEAGKVERISPLMGREEKSVENFEVSPDNNLIAFLGNEGYILLASLRTRQWAGNLKMNGSVRAVSFAENGRQLMSIGGDGEIYHWDLRMRRCFHKGRDEGCLKATALGVSQDNHLFATGSGSGVVNIYNKGRFVGGHSSPVKSLLNLTTTVDNVKFNGDSQILAITSRMMKNAVRLVHLPSYTVFSNWPARAPLSYVHSLDFSPGGGYLALGNSAGRVLLYRLRHYQYA